MSGRVLEFIIDGETPPQGSMRNIGKGRMIHQNSKKIKKYRKLTSSVISNLRSEFFVSDTDVAYKVEVIIYILRPKSVKRKYPTVRGCGDIDKLMRALLDALTYDIVKNPAGIIPDDSTVIGIKAWKIYTDNIVKTDKAYVRITKILSKEDEDLPNFDCFNDEEKP